MRHPNVNPPAPPGPIPPAPPAAPAAASLLRRLPVFGPMLDEQDRRQRVIDRLERELAGELKNNVALRTELKGANDRLKNALAMIKAMQTVPKRKPEARSKRKVA